jgi:putative transcriptional regulator
MPKQNAILLREKSEFTKFQILFEIMRNQPHIKQKDIGKTLDLTTQAISKYFKKLIKDGLIDVGTERADYRLTPKGVTVLRQGMLNLENYVRAIKNELKVEHAWTALTTYPVRSGDQVGLISRDGLFYAVPPNGSSAEAMGTALFDANPGEDIGLKDLAGKVKLVRGRIMIVKLPSIRRGGSRAVDIALVKRLFVEFKPDRVGIMGAVARAVVTKLDVKVDFEFGICHSAAVAASRGLNVLVLVVGRMVNRVILEVDNQNMRFGSGVLYEVRDAQLS